MLIGSETSLHFSYQISFAFQHCDSIVWRGEGHVKARKGEKVFAHMEWHFLNNI